jgi:hypothetical protein
VFFGEIDRASSSFGGGRLAPPVATNKPMDSRARCARSANQTLPSASFIH